MNLRVIGTSKCGTCVSMVSQFRMAKVRFEYIDADKPEYQEQLDAWGVTDMPVLHLLEGDKIIAKHVGPKSVRGLGAWVERVKSKQEEAQ